MSFTVTKWSMGCLTHTILLPRPRFGVDAWSVGMASSAFCFARFEGGSEIFGVSCPLGRFLPPPAIWDVSLKECRYKEGWWIWGYKVTSLLARGGNFVSGGDYQSMLTQSNLSNKLSYLHTYLEVLQIGGNHISHRLFNLTPYTW